MKNKLIIILIFLMAIMTITTVSANDNITSEISDTPLNQDENLTVSEDETLKDTQTTQLQAENVKGYETTETIISAKLTSNNQPLTSKTIQIIINGETYSKNTNDDGVASIGVILPIGTYTAEFKYSGDDLTSPCDTTSQITIMETQKTSLKVGDKDINYRQGSKCLFYVKLKNSEGKEIKNQWVTIEINNKIYNVQTNENGNAKIYLKLKKGKYKIKYKFNGTGQYKASSGTYTIKVKPKMAKGNGYWVWSSHMKTVNLKKLASKGTRHILLHVHAIAQYGKSSVVSFIKIAHHNHMKVHLWMQVCYSGGKWVSLVKDNGKFKYSFMKKKIAEAKRYAKIKGVDGVHFDYMRYGGTAHKHINAKESINYFVKKATKTIRKVKSNCMVSVAVMPEPSAMLYYYGQDIPTLSKYVDSIIPMVYKGNYHQPRSWITSVTKKFVSQSNGAQIWTGLQSYHSDSNPSKLTQKTLRKDAKAAVKGGSIGVMLFRFGISCNFNFKKI